MSYEFPLRCAAEIVGYEPLACTRHNNDSGDHKVRSACTDSSHEFINISGPKMAERYVYPCCIPVDNDSTRLLPSEEQLLA